MLNYLLWAVVIIFILGYLLKLYMRGKANPYNNTSLLYKTIIVTGGTSGIGRECVKQFCKLNAETVIFTGRNEKAALALTQQISQLRSSQTKLVFQKVDFADLVTVKKFADFILQKYKTIDLILNNAGASFQEVTYTQQGFEASQGVNHIAVQYLNGLLFPVLSQREDTRVVQVSSGLHEMAKENGLPNYKDFHFKISPYPDGGFFAYSRSKTENVLFTKGLQLFIEKKGLQDKVVPVSLHPGVILTELGRNMKMGVVSGKLFKLAGKTVLKNAWEGAQTSLYCCLCPKGVLVSGAYYDNCGIKEPYSGTKKFEEIQKLWNFTNKEIERTIGLEGYMFTDL